MKQKLQGLERMFAKIFITKLKLRVHGVFMFLYVHLGMSKVANISYNQNTLSGHSVSKHLMYTKSRCYVVTVV